jgi:hypothetical protein
MQDDDLGRKVTLGVRKPAKLRLHSTPCTDQVENSARRVATFSVQWKLYRSVLASKMSMGNYELIRAHFRLQLAFQDWRCRGSKLYVQMILEL